MKAVMKTVIKTPLRYVILVCLILATAGSLYYFLGVSDPKISTLVGGICGGLIVYIINFLLTIYEYKSIDRFRELGIKEVLPNRRSTDYYSDLLSKANEIVVVVGTSCTRFIDDFANKENDKHILIDALRKNRNLKVQLMVPQKDYMDNQSKTRFGSGKSKLKKLLNDFPQKVEMRCFSFYPRYSFVRVDDDLIVGPVFVDTESKNSPAIHLNVNSAFSEKYINDFNRIWENSPVYDEDSY